MSMTESRSHGRSGPIAGPGVGRHLLIVDDDDRIRELLKEFLAREGYRVTGAAHAAAAKRMMELIEFDLVVLDVMMPGESGLDLTSWVRNKAELSKTPVLLLTARGDPEDRIEGLSRGADDYMSKPFEPRELLVRIRNLLRRPRVEAPAPAGVAVALAAVATCAIGPAGLCHVRPAAAALAACGPRPGPVSSGLALPDRFREAAETPAVWPAPDLSCRRKVKPLELPRP